MASLVEDDRKAREDFARANADQACTQCKDAQQPCVKQDRVLICTPCSQNRLKCSRQDDWTRRKADRRHSLIAAAPGVASSSSSRHRPSPAANTIRVPPPAINQYTHLTNSNSTTTAAEVDRQRLREQELAKKDHEIWQLKNRIALMEEETDDRTKVLVQTIQEKDQTIQGNELGKARLKEELEETAAALVTARRTLEKRNEKLEKIEFLLDFKEKAEKELRDLRDTRLAEHLVIGTNKRALKDTLGRFSSNKINDRTFQNYMQQHVEFLDALQESHLEFTTDLHDGVELIKNRGKRTSDGGNIEDGEDGERTAKKTKT